mgnify:FL=1
MAKSLKGLKKLVGSLSSSDKSEIAKSMKNSKVMKMTGGGAVPKSGIVKMNMGGKAGVKKMNMGGKAGVRKMMGGGKAGVRKMMGGGKAGVKKMNMGGKTKK